MKNLHYINVFFVAITTIIKTYYGVRVIFMQKTAAPLFRYLAKYLSDDWQKI